MNHESWNEIGNLYFMFGAYEPAIHAYLRSIKLENKFGRSYSNLAMVYVETAKYTEAIKLYRRSLELLSDKKEKAATWNRLGILYRQIKEYDNALEAYQQADLIMPQDAERAEKLSEVRADAKLPLTVSMPEIDLDAILATDNSEDPQMQGDLLTEINTEFEMAESDQEGSMFEEMMLWPPDKASGSFEFENYSQAEDAFFEPPISTHSEWKLAYTDEIILVDEKPALAELEATFHELDDMEIIIPFDAQSVVVTDGVQTNLPVSEIQPEAGEISEPPDLNQTVDLVQSATFPENTAHFESAGIVTNEADMEAAHYSQMDYPLTELSAEEQQLLELEIIKYQQATSKQPRSYILWEGLGEAYKSAGQYKDAIQAFQKAISLNPANPKSYYRLGLVYAAERKEQEAIKSFEKVLELKPDSAQAHASLASQYRKMGFDEAAQEHIEKARAMQLEEESDYNHACLEAICGNNERALELLEVALQSKQTDVTWAQNDPDFDSLRADHRFQMLLSANASAA